MKATLKKPKGFYQQHSPSWAKIIKDSALAIAVAPVAIILALTGHPELAASLASGLTAYTAASFVGEKKTIK